MLNIFKKKPIVCFFCKDTLKPEETFTIQYASKDGLHSQKMCSSCAQTFNEIVDTVEELKDVR